MVHRYFGNKFRPNFAYGPYNPYYGYGFGYGGIYSPYPLRDPYYTYADAMHYREPIYRPRARPLAYRRTPVAPSAVAKQPGPSGWEPTLSSLTLGLVAAGFAAVAVLVLLKR